MDFDFGFFDMQNEHVTDFSSFDGYSDPLCCADELDWSLPKFQAPLFKVAKDVAVQPVKAKKTFKCEECNKEYKTKENYLLHYSNKHLKQKPYKCRFCAMRYSHRNGRRYHEKNHHERLGHQSAQLTHLSHLVKV